MNGLTNKSTDFIAIYNKSQRLVTAIFAVSNNIDQEEELKSKIKSLSLELVSVSVNLKDIDFFEAKKLIDDIEKKSLLLMSMLDIASVTNLISEMNGNIIREEFKSFLVELSKFSTKFEDEKSVHVKNILSEPLNTKEDSEALDAGSNVYTFPKTLESKKLSEGHTLAGSKNDPYISRKNGNGGKRKEFRKSMILDFIKGHNNVNIKDIIPNIVGCSEKTIQRELINLINEGKIKKIGERRWSRYSIN